MKIKNTNKNSAANILKTTLNLPDNIKISRPNIFNEIDDLLNTKVEKQN